MDLQDIVNRAPRPEPWAEGEKIPWSEPGFSRRMLAEHLSQEHDLASRRTEHIDSHVAWIHGRLLGGRPSRILDLCCGPGLYCHRLAALGHTCLGIDFAPASIEYARAHAPEDGDRSTFVESDVRAAEIVGRFDLAMLIFGELNVFRPDDARRILRKAADALAPGGWLVLEPQTPEVVRSTGLADRSWSAHASGLFSDRPHLLLEENDWRSDVRVATTRYFVVDAVSGSVTRHAASVQAYDPAELVAALGETGIDDVRVLSSPGDEELRVQDGLMWLVGQR